MRAVGVCVEDVENQDKWKSRTWVASSSLKGGHPSNNREKV